MILSTRGRYAVMALADLAMHSDGRPVCLADIAERQEIPLSYLEQIFARLRRAGLVASVRGPGGGYQLERTAADIRISGIVTAAEESIRMTRCHTEKTGCMGDGTQCLTHDLWEGLGNHIHDYLDGITLEDLCRKRLPGQCSSIPSLSSVI